MNGTQSMNLDEYDRYNDLVSPANGKPKTNQQVDNLAKYAMLKAGIDPYEVMSLPKSEQCFEHDIETAYDKQARLLIETLEYDRETRMKHLPPHIGVDYFPYMSLKTESGHVYSSISYKPIYILF